MFLSMLVSIKLSAVVIRDFNSGMDFIGDGWSSYSLIKPHPKIYGLKDKKIAMYVELHVCDHLKFRS